MRVTLIIKKAPKKEVAKETVEEDVFNKFINFVNKCSSSLKDKNTKLYVIAYIPQAPPKAKIINDRPQDCKRIGKKFLTKCQQM